MNFLIHRTIFKKVTFNEKLSFYGNEDVLFSYNLKQEKVFIEHIENWIYHLGIQTTGIFLEKTRESSNAFLFLLENKLLPHNYTPYGRAYKLVVDLKLKKVISILFHIAKPLLIKNLKSKHPSMFLFDLYRLGYICSL